MFMGLGMPIPDLSNKPGPGRPGWSTGTYDFQFRVEGQDAVVIKANAAAGGSFTVKWPNGSTQVLSGNNTSITAPDATDGIVSINNENDADYCDQFAVVGGQGVVREVISWGSNPWKSLANAFQNCSNLTSLSDTTLTTASTCNFQYAFNDCTSIEYVDLRKWDLSQGINNAFWFEGCSNLGEIDMTGSSISLYSRSDNMFANIGGSTTDGCLFKMSGVNWSNTGNSQWFNMFFGSKIKKDSTFANWVFPSSISTSISFFKCVFPMQDTTLDCSGWTTYSGTTLPYLSQLNYNYNGYAQPPSSSTGFKIDITNLNVSNVTNLQQAFYYSFQDEVVGLSTLGATNGATSMNIMFAYNKFMKFTATNNFSNTFISSLNLNSSTSLNQTFRQISGSVADAEAGVPPNLSGLDLSNIDTIDQTFVYSKYSTGIDFTNVTMNASTNYNFNQTFRNCKFVDGGNVNTLFSKTFGISSLSGAFRSARMGSIIFGSNIDLSATTSFSLAFYDFGGDIASPIIEFADNVSFASANDWNQTFSSVGTTFNPLSTCQVDNFIRRLYATQPTAPAVTYKTIDFQNSSVTESPSVVRGLADTLVNTGGYILDLNTTDATIPFEYPSFVEPGVATAPTNNTGSAFTGIFSSSNSNIPVNSETGVIDTTNTGNTTIRYTLSDGCYTEQAILVASPFTTSWNIDSDFVNQTFYYRVATQGTANNNTYFDYQIDWGDGSAMESFTDNTTPNHTYTSTGTYDIKVVGMIPGMTLSYRSGNQFYARPEAEKLLEIKKWGDCKFSSFYYGFGGCKNMTITATDNPTFRQAGVAGHMNNFFRNCHKITSYDFTPWQVMFENLPTGGMEYLCSGTMKMEQVTIPSCTITNSGGNYNDSIFNSTGFQAGIEILNAGSGLTAGNYTTTDTGDFAIRLFEVDSNGSAMDGRIGLFNADGWAENAVFNFTGGLQVRINKAKPGNKIIMKDITWSHDPKIRYMMYNAVVEDADLSGWTITSISQMQQWFFINNANYQQMTVNMDNWTATGNGITSMRSLMTGNRYDSTGNFKGPKILKTTNWDSSVTENLTDFGQLGNTSSGKYSRLREWWGLDQIKLGKVTNFARMFEYMSFIVFKSENGRNFANDCFNNRVSTPSSISATLLGNTMSSNVDFSQESNAEIINLSGWTFDATNPVSLQQAFYQSNHPGDDTTASGGVWWDLSSTDMSNVSSLLQAFRRIGYIPNSSPYVNRPTEKRTIKINDLTTTMTNMSYLGQQSTITDYDFTGCNLSNVTTLERVFSANINRQSPKEPYTLTYSNTGNLNSVTNGVSFVDGSTPLRTSDYDNILRALSSTSVTNGDFRAGATKYNAGLIFTDGRTPEQMTDTTTANKVVDENKNFEDLGVSVGDIVEIRRANSNPIVYASVTAVSETELTLSASIIADNNYRYYNIQTSDAAKDRFALDVTNSWYIADGGPVIE